MKNVALTNCWCGFADGWDEVIKMERRPGVYKSEWNKDAAGVIGKLSWHPCRVCFRSSLHSMWLIAVATVGHHRKGAFWHEIFVTAIKGKPWIIKGRREANIKDMGGSETAQQPDKLSHERGGIGRQHVSDGCVTDAVNQCHSVRACPSANGHSSSFGMLLPINEECRFDELLVRFRRWVGRSGKKER